MAEELQHTYYGLCRGPKIFMMFNVMAVIFNDLGKTRSKRKKTGKRVCIFLPDNMVYYVTQPKGGSVYKHSIARSLFTVSKFAFTLG